MTDKLKILSKEGNPAIQGIIISAIVIFAGIFPTIEIGSFKLYNPLDSWSIFLFGFSSLFYFISMKVNQDIKIDEHNREWTITPYQKSKLSKECFILTEIIFILFILRIMYLFITNFLLK